jgi:carboxyl-terminal processing protease
VRYHCVYKVCAAGFPFAAVPVVCVSRLFQRLVFAGSVVIFAALGLGYVLGEFGWLRRARRRRAGCRLQARCASTPRSCARFRTTTSVEPNIPEVTNGALHGLLDSLDPDSSYLSAAEYKIYKDRPATDNAQVGITVSKRFGYATIVNVLPGSPADQEPSPRRRCDRSHRRPVHARSAAGSDPLHA